MSMPADYLTRDEFHTTLTLRFLEMRKEFQRLVLDQIKDQKQEMVKYVAEQRKESERQFKMFVIEQRKEFERYTGALKEHFAGGIEAVIEGVSMNIEKTDRLDQYSKKEFDGLDRRLSQVEMTKARKRILKDEGDKKKQKGKR